MSRTTICILACALAACVPRGLAAQRGRAELNEGNRLYEEGRFEEAHEKYLEALRDAPESPLARFNDGNALYQTEEYRRALEAYRQAIEVGNASGTPSGNPSLAGPAWYNLGNALYREGQFQESLDAFKQALRIDPGEDDYKHNLERALEQLEQQEQQTGDGDSQDQEGDPDQQERDDPEQDQGDQEQEQGDQNQGPPPESGEEDEPQGGEPQPAPGGMTREEAERLLQAVQEDPEDVNRRQAPLRGRRPRKPW